MNVEAKSRPLFLSNVLENDEKRGASISYEF